MLYAKKDKFLIFMNLMETKSTPFSTNTFQKVWKKHFIKNKKVESFKFLEGLNFYKGRFSIFFNIGRNLTKGNSYTIKNYQDYKNKVFMIYDILPHLNTQINDFPKNLGILKSIQYPGFLINLNQFSTIDDYLLNTFSKNTRMKMRKFTKRLDKCFNISTKMLYGDVNKQEYDKVFDDFMILLKKRYSEKQISYNNMQPDEWSFYKEVALPLIEEKKASLFVVYDDQTPIAITYNYHTDSSLIDAITVFDIDYSKFNIGYVNNLKLLDWCFDNDIKTLDFSKGYFDYKKRMSSMQYDFEYHIIFDKKSILSKLKAYGYHNFFKLKAYLRNKNIDIKFHKFTYKIKYKNQSKLKKKIEITKLDCLPSLDKLSEVDILLTEDNSLLRKHVYDFLYLVVQPYNEIKSYKIKSKEGIYILSNGKLNHQIKILE